MRGLARLTCLSCKAPLPKLGARCSICGWAVDYSPETSRREREVIFGITFIAIGIFLLIAFAVLYELVR